MLPGIAGTEIASMSKSSFVYRYRVPLGPPEERSGAPPVYRCSVVDGMIIEKDVAVTLRDGVRIYIDVFRPEDERPATPTTMSAFLGIGRSVGRTLLAARQQRRGACQR